jgi:diaminopimelate decarboxylase
MSAPLDFFQYDRSQNLCADGIRLSEIAQKLGTPVYVYNAAAFLEPLKEFKKGLRSLDHLVCFAVKSNSSLAILKMLAQAGAGMDLVSGGELYRAEKAGVPRNRIVFSGVGKTSVEIEAALRSGIFSFNVESLPELKLINSVALKKKKVAPVALRFNPDVNAKTHPYISTGLKKNKFGLNRQEILDLLPELKRLKGISLQGLSIHIGSQLLSLKPLEESFHRLKELTTEVEKILGHAIRFLDLGGGLGISYETAKAKSPSIKDYCALITKNFGPHSDFKSKKIVLEPGRVLSGNGGVLLSTVLYRKERKTKDFLIIDAGMNDLLRPALYGSHHDILPLKQAHGKTRLTDVVGPVCETSDCLGSDRQMGTEILAGDLVAVLSSGAYGFTMSSNYNSRPRPPEVLIQNGKAKIIRKRETHQDLIRGEVML